MRHTIKYIIAALFTCIFCLSHTKIYAQTSSVDIAINLQKLDKLGAVMYFAAHPDDENTKLIAWFAREKKFRTAYLSLTRGDGGQNLLGTDLGINLGLIRTYELLAARQVDKGEQLFSSAYDFGFSKTHEETFKFWDHETILREAVWLIRKYQPDIIITRFPPDKRGGHGHHQASAILAHEAFIAAADKNKFPEQLDKVSVWQAKRLVWNTANFGGQNNTSEEQLKIDIGQYNTLLGASYGEISAWSRSQHKTQGFGSASSRGTSIEYFEHVAGEKAQKDLFDGINTSWSRIANSQEVQSIITQLIKEYEFTNPAKSVNKLIALRKKLNTLLKDKKYNFNERSWINQKRSEVDDLLIACSGLWTDAYTQEPQFVKNKPFQTTIEATVNNPGIEVRIISINDSNTEQILDYNKVWRNNIITVANRITQPYWLDKPHTLGRFDVPLDLVGNPTNPDNPHVEIKLSINGQLLVLKKNINHRFVDPVKGEIRNPIVILPELTAEVPSLAISTNQQAKQIQVTFTRHNTDKNSFPISLESPKGWTINPSAFDLNFDNKDKITKTINIQPQSSRTEKGVLSFLYENEPIHTIQTLSYDHVPRITWFPIANIKAQHMNLQFTAKHIGYLAGAGDLVAESLSEIGLKVTPLTQQDLEKSSYLNQFDAIVLGVRYFNVIEKSKNALEKLLKYAEEGGVVLVQYNVNTKLLSDQLGPYHFVLSRDRVTEEDSPISFDEKDIVMQYPNKITAEDFEGWIQERGLYFAQQVDPKYRTPLYMYDKDEDKHAGSLLITKYGKGKFVYTSLSFFRQLPAGIPGAYRLFVNLLTNEN